MSHISSSIIASKIYTPVNWIAVLDLPTDVSWLWKCSDKLYMLGVSETLRLKLKRKFGAAEGPSSATPSENPTYHIQGIPI